MLQINHIVTIFARTAIDLTGIVSINFECNNPRGFSLTNDSFNRLKYKKSFFRWKTKLRLTKKVERVYGRNSWFHFNKKFQGKKRNFHCECR